jgi:hypothetical protein
MGKPLRGEADLRVTEVQVSRDDLAGTLGTMRTWLDHNDAGSTQFETVHGTNGFILVRVELATEALAEAFRREFSSRA